MCQETLNPLNETKSKLEGVVLLNQVKFWCIHRIPGYDSISQGREPERKRERVRKRDH